LRVLIALPLEPGRVPASTPRTPAGAAAPAPMPCRRRTPGRRTARLGAV